MNNTVFRNEKCIADEKVLKQFRKEIEKRGSYIECIEDLVEIYAKNPADHFIVTDKPLKTEVAQRIIQQMQKDEQEKLDRYNAEEKAKWEKKVKEDEIRRQNALKTKEAFDNMQNWAMLD